MRSDPLSRAFVLLDNLETQMIISAVADTLANLETKRSGHHKIESLYRKTVDKVNTLSELHRCEHGNDAEKAVELVLNDGLYTMSMRLRSDPLSRAFSNQ